MKFFKGILFGLFLVWAVKKVVARIFKALDKFVTQEREDRFYEWVDEAFFPSVTKKIDDGILRIDKYFGDPKVVERSARVNAERAARKKRMAGLV